MPITLDHTKILPIFRGNEYPDSVKVSAAVEAGRMVSPGADGRYGPGNGAGGGVTITRAISQNRTVSLMREGEIDLGDGVQALASGAPIYATVDGTLTDAATETVGTTTVNNVQVGNLIPVKGGPAAAINANGFRLVLRLAL